MTLIRCTNCNKVLLEAELKNGTIKKKCDRCGVMNIITTESDTAGQSFQDRMVRTSTLKGK